MASFELIKKPIPEIEEYLRKFDAELRQTRLPDTYLIKLTPETDTDQPEVNQIKGLIFNHRTGQIHSLTYPVPINFNVQSENKQQQIIENIKQKPYQVQKLLDGTLLRYSYIEEIDEWILSTNSKMDASQAYWMNGISFAKQFTSIKKYKIDTNKLDKNHIYLFILCHPLNVIVVNIQEPEIYHVATYDKKTLTEITCDSNLGIPVPTKLDLTVDQVVDQISHSASKPVDTAGYMIISKQENQLLVRYRFENTNYLRAKELRGNSNNIDFTLLSLLEQKGESAVEEFLQYYPIYWDNYKGILEEIEMLGDRLYQQYGERYKLHQNIVVHHRHHKFLQEIHQIYLNHLKAKKQTIKRNDIIDFIYQQPAAKILYLINYIYDK